MGVPDLALAASARAWPDRVHRFLLDHGGGRVRLRAMSPEQTLDGQFDVLLIDDVCSFLTPRLVLRIRDQGKEILGVFSPEDGPDAKRHLLECGISDVIEAGATPEEFMAAVASTLAHRTDSQAQAIREGSGGLRIAVSGAATGVGATEVALGLADSLSRQRSTVLVDVDQQHPGLAQRLGLAVHPNLRSAVDVAHHEPGRLGEVFHQVDRLKVVPGPPTPGLETPLPQNEVENLLQDLGHLVSTVVVDLGDGAPLVDPSVMLLVGAGTPVGLTRLIQRASGSARGGNVPLLIINRAPRDGHRRDDIRSELSRSLPGLPCLFLPFEPRLDRASWDGFTLRHGGFARGIRRIARLIGEASPT